MVLAWVLIYASDPLYMLYAKVVSQFEFRWDKIFDLWCYSTAFLVLFLIHHYVLVPILVKKKSKVKYLLGVVASITAFITFLVVCSPKFDGDKYKGSKIDMEMKWERHHKNGAKPPLLTPPDLGRVVMALMMIGVDLGAVAWINDERMRQRLLMLEQQNLKQELEHLRYQINPHFFMNTLNNIHALVDLDQERAKRAIVELSGLMRYTLYEGNNTLVELRHEAEFLHLYISLMKPRYSDKVEIVYNMPESAPSDIMMPPMIFVTFVENAFKHGVSYLEKSYIHADISINDDDRTICFRCVNSIHRHQSATEDGHHGIGLENVRKRLDLQYAGKYTLNIEEKGEEFVVELILPCLNS